TLLVPVVSRRSSDLRRQPRKFPIRSRRQDVEEVAADAHQTHRPNHRQEHPVNRFRLVPPAGAPLPVRHILRAMVPEREHRRGSAELLVDHLGPHNSVFVSSGRAALTILLKVLREGSDRREVVIPAYTCFSVPSAVVRAGLTIRLCDVDPKTL